MLSTKRMDSKFVLVIFCIFFSLMSVFLFRISLPIASSVLLPASGHWLFSSHPNITVVDTSLMMMRSDPPCDLFTVDLEVHIYDSKKSRYTRHRTVHWRGKQTPYLSPGSLTRQTSLVTNLQSRGNNACNIARLILVLV